MTGFATALGIYAAICGLLWAGFVRLEGLLKEDTREGIGKWVRGAELTDRKERWPATFVAVFDRVFGEKHLSWQCFWRSCVASALAVVVITVAGIALNATFEQKVGQDVLVSLIFIGLMGALVNLFPDYISLLETRFVIRCMSGRQDARYDESLDKPQNPHGQAGALRLLGWLIFDAIITLAIIVMAILVPFFLFSSTPTVSSFVQLVMGGLGLPFGGSEDSIGLGVFIYSTFFTSVWVWLYAFSGIAVRLVYRVKRIRAFLDTHLDLANRPMSVMGGTLIVIFTVIYWPAIAINALA